MNPNEYVMGSTTFYSTGPEDKPADKPATTTSAPRTNTPTTSNQTTQANNPPATQPSALSNDWKFLDDPRFKDLPGTQAYRNFALGKGFTGNLLPDTLKNFKFFGQNPESVRQYIEKGLEKQITPQTAQKALTDQYQKTQQDKLYNQYFRVDQHGNTVPNNPNIKIGTKGYGGATFGLNTFYSQDYSKTVAKTPGAGVWSLGIDPRDPNAEALATVWISKHQNDQNGPGTPWYKILGGGKWGRFDAKMPGLSALKAQYPKASNLQLLDAVTRMTHSQAALEPTDVTMQILGPILVAAGGFLGPIAATAMGSTMAGSTAAALGAGTMGTITSGIASDWDPTATLLGGGTAAFSAGMGFDPTATMAQKLTQAGIDTAIGATGFINPNLPIALNLGRGAYTGATTGKFDPLLRRGASYALQGLLPQPYGQLAALAVQAQGRRTNRGTG